MFLRAGIIVVLNIAMATGIASAQQSHPEKIAILNSLSEISRAYVARDPRPFEKIYTENFVSVRERPVFNLRNQLIAMMRADSVPLRQGQKLDFMTLSYETVNPSIHLYPGSAVVTSVKNNLWEYRGKRCMTKYQTTELWVKPAESWKLAASHATIFHCKERPYYPIHQAVAMVEPLTRMPIPDESARLSELKTAIKSLRSFAFSSESTSDVLADDFVSTGIDGVVATDTATLKNLIRDFPQHFSGSADAYHGVVILENTATLTIHGRPKKLGSRVQQSSLFFVRIENEWRLAAVHTSPYA